MNTANKNGFLFGLSCPGELMTKKVPVAYLYNGVRLPKLPEWDRETYPYAYILEHPDARELFVVMSLPLEYRTITADFEGNGTAQTKTMLLSYAPPNTIGKTIGHLLVGDLWYYAGPDEWDGGNNGSYYGFTFYNQVPVWANTDVRNADSGGIYFTASEPIPVYE